MNHKSFFSILCIFVALGVGVIGVPAAFADDESLVNSELQCETGYEDAASGVVSAADGQANQALSAGETTFASGVLVVCDEQISEIDNQDGVGESTGKDVASADGHDSDSALEAVEEVVPTAQIESFGAQANSLSDGVYVIASALNQNKCLDVPGASNANSTPMNLYDRNETPAQRWSVTAAGDGLYEIVNVASGKALDVAGAQKANGVSVQQYSRNKTNAQKWKIVADGDGSYKIVSALSDAFALDVAGASQANGTRVQIWSDNGTVAQRWVFASAQAVADGFYVVENVGSGKVLDVAGGSSADGANIQQYTKNSTAAQTFYFTYDDATGYYTITDLGSGKVLDVAGGGSWNGANVNQYAHNGTRAQMWSVMSTANGSYVLRSSLSGLALDVSGASKADGANVQMYASNGTNAQRWRLEKKDHALAEGTFEIASAKNASNVIDIAGGSTSAGANVQMYLSNSSNAQKFFVRSMGNGTYALQNPLSGLYLSVDRAASGANVFLGTTAQRFSIAFGPGGYEIRVAENPSFVIDVAGGSTASGANVQVYAANSTLAQRFVLRSTNMFANGMYSIRFAADTNYVIDVPGASGADNLALHLYESNGTNAQRFMIRAAGGDAYAILSQCSSKYLEIGAADDGTRVLRQAASRNSDDQLWTFSLAGDGKLTVSPRSNANVALTVGSGAQNYSPVLFGSKNGTAAQAWKLQRESANVVYDYLNLTLERMARLQENGVSVDKLMRLLDPAAIEQSEFLDLRIATDVTGAELDRFIASTSLGQQGKLSGLGWAFVSAAQQYGLNEVYLLAHAILESAWGTSALASGYYYDGGWIDGAWYDAGTYYNFYGIGAIDSSPLSGGRKLAIINGWNTPQAAVIGAARWIASNYTYASSYAQPTLYAMKWDYARTSASGNRGWHQYATSVTWPNSIANLINQCYAFAGKASSGSYVIPQYL